MESKYTDCTNYDDCIKNQKIMIDLPNNDILSFITMGCWGVYCNSGKYKVAKFKKDDIKYEVVERGQKNVSDLLLNYTKSLLHTNLNITDIFLTGDNIYQLGISEEMNDSQFKEEKSRLAEENKQSHDVLNNFNMELQLSDGFENCFRKSPINRFFITIGNHDIETCEVLSKQYNYNGWILPSLYYNVTYFLKGYNLNFIILDTNMYEEVPEKCDKTLFTEEEIRKQTAWAINSARKDAYNIIIGHIPYLANGHKEKKPIVYNEKLAHLVRTIKPVLYICADEHNMQLIKDDDTTIIVAGSGGTQLDPLLDRKIPQTIYAESAYGFVHYIFAKNEIKIKFKKTDNSSYVHNIQLNNQDT